LPPISTSTGLSMLCRWPLQNMAICSAAVGALLKSGGAACPTGLRCADDAWDQMSDRGLISARSTLARLCQMKLRRRHGGILKSYPKLGPILYVAGIQYFVVQLLSALRWSPPYSMSRDTISDLGNTACGTWNGRYVCSPSHDLMNWSFIVLGATMMAGSVLIFRHFAKGRAAAAGFAAMTASGFGVVMVGIFPENSVSVLHGLGTAIPFVLGNIALFVLALTLEMTVLLRAYSFLSGGVALLALMAYASSHYLGLGEGGIERVVAYPQTVCLAVIGCYLIVKSSVSSSASAAGAPGTAPAPGRAARRP